MIIITIEILTIFNETFSDKKPISPNIVAIPVIIERIIENNFLFFLFLNLREMCKPIFICKI